MASEKLKKKLKAKAEELRKKGGGGGLPYFTFKEGEKNEATISRRRY